MITNAAFWCVVSLFVVAGVVSVIVAKPRSHYGAETVIRKSSDTSFEVGRWSPPIQIR